MKYQGRTIGLVQFVFGFVGNDLPGSKKHHGTFGIIIIFVAVPQIPAVGLFDNDRIKTQRKLCPFQRVRLTQIHQADERMQRFVVESIVVLFMPPQPNVDSTLGKTFQEPVLEKA